MKNLIFFVLASLFIFSLVQSAEKKEDGYMNFVVLVEIQGKDEILVKNKKDAENLRKNLLDSIKQNGNKGFGIRVMLGSEISNKEKSSKTLSMCMAYRYEYKSSYHRFVHVEPKDRELGEYAVVAEKDPKKALDLFLQEIRVNEAIRHNK